MWDTIAKIFSGGVLSSVEKIALEAINTDEEKASAKALWIKTLDPNGLMRRDLSKRVSGLYTVYVMVTLFLILMESWGIGGIGTDGLLYVSHATEKIKDLFTPITSLFGIIVTASFGVNMYNVKKGV
jgi:hypothetical protein